MRRSLVYVKCAAKALAKVLGKQLANHAGVPEHFVELPVDLAIEWAEYLYEEWEESPAEFMEAQRDLIAEGNDLSVEQLNAALDEAFLNQPEPVRMTALALLAQVQSQTRQSMKRSGDPSGTSLPPTHTVESPDDLITTLPNSIPRFKKGDSPIQGWVLGDRLGGGGMGEVYVAHNPTRPNLTTAIKFFLDPKGRSWLSSHEADVVEHVQGQVFHPGIVQLRNVYDELACLQFEYVKGWPLSRQILDWKLAGQNEPMYMARQFRKIVEILVDVHLIKPVPIVHRDIKPANILVELVPNGRARFRITDFGIGGYAIAETVRKTRIGTRTGPRNPSLLRGSATEVYASPQQLAGSDPDPRDDVYSLGVVWYQMQSGQLRHKPVGDWEDELRDDPTHPVPSEILALMRACFASKPEKRPANAKELVDRLDALLGSKDAPPAPRPEPPQPPPSEPKPKVRVEPVVEAPKPKTLQELIKTKTADIQFKLIPDGSFMMGSPDGKGDDDERPQHKVTISKPFYMGVTPITQSQYAKLMGKNPSYFASTGDGKSKVAGMDTSRFPVERVAWFEAAQFCNALSKKEGIDPYYRINGIDGGTEGEKVEIINRAGKGFRLPTEAEWEYCARAGHKGEYGYNGDVGSLEKYAWFDKNAGGRPHPVGEKNPNDFGLYDTLGNVWEWCWDGFAGDYYLRSPEIDPPGPDQAPNRVLRGGSWGLLRVQRSGGVPGQVHPGVPDRAPWFSRRPSSVKKIEKSR